MAHMAEPGHRLGTVHIVNDADRLADAIGAGRLAGCASDLAEVPVAWRTVGSAQSDSGAPRCIPDERFNKSSLGGRPSGPDVGGVLGLKRGRALHVVGVTRIASILEQAIERTPHPQQRTESVGQPLRRHWPSSFG
jgi:hypothetical protein